MIKIRLHPNLNDVAVFISHLNSFPEHHIGYCGKKVDEIFNTLEKGFTDVSANDAFLVATERNEIVGVLGFDADIERGNAEIWGPFVDHHNTSQVSKMLWESIVSEIPDTVHTVSLFPDNCNKTVFDLADALCFDSVSKETILTCTRKSLKEINSDNVITLSRNYSPLVKLHDQLFPGTYLTGNEMVKGLGEKSTAFGVVDKNNDLLGYLYAEADPEFAEGSIEFFGVNPSSRGKGVGSSLLAKGLQWLFTFQTIEEITVCVQSDNSKAIRLYKSIGFQIDHVLTLFSKQINKIYRK